MNIARYIDHTVLKAATTIEDIRKLCSEAREFQFAAVCVPPPFVQTAQQLLHNDPVKTATVIGFPFGYSCIAAKMEEIRQAIHDQADELDVVINLIDLKQGHWDHIQQEVQQLTDYTHQHKKIIKVIVESGVLTREELIQCCETLKNTGIDFMKTSTGYAEKGASVEAVQIMRQHLPASIQIKASGGIRDFDFASQLVEAGATRLGCSASVAIVKGQNNSTGIAEY